MTEEFGKRFDTVINSIRTERLKQIKKGYDFDHDDSHDDGSIITSNWGALSRLLSASQVGDKHVNYDHLLIQSASMICAELERIDRRLDKQIRDGTCDE